MIKLKTHDCGSFLIFFNKDCLLVNWSYLSFYIMFKWKLFCLHLPSVRIIEVCYQPAYRLLRWKKGCVCWGKKSPNKQKLSTQLHPSTVWTFTDKIFILIWLLSYVLFRNFLFEQQPESVTDFMGCLASWQNEEGEELYAPVACKTWSLARTMPSKQGGSEALFPACLVRSK